MTSIDPPSRSGTPTLGPPSRSMSPSPSLASLAHRPQPPGSLHARIRSAHAAPMSAPITVDVLAPPSRSSTPVQKAPPSPLSPAPDAHHADGPHSQGGPSADIGIYPEAVYDEYLGEWIGAIRRHLIRSLRWESEWLAWHQSIVRTPRLDRYFVYTSLLGTHSFFLIFLPMSFWASNAYFGRGLINVLAFGVYFSSVAKDLFCVPRPYSPPCTRLVIGTTHLEYGFLSTHSTNASAVALYIYLWVREMRVTAGAPDFFNSWGWEVGLLYYYFSVVYGRIYAGMHSVTDCVAGTVLGVAITVTQWRFQDSIERFMLIDDWTVPAVIIPAGLLMVSIHPQPLDDCPCFEDAIAFLSVVMGIVVGRWFNVRSGILPLKDRPLDPTWPADYDNVTNRLINASAAAAEPVIAALTAPLERLVQVTSRRHPILGAALYSVRTLVMLIVGVICIFLVRVATKTVCRVILPPILAFTQRTFGVILPRRHYFSAAAHADVAGSAGEAPPALPRVMSPTPEQASSRRRAGSLERSKIKFTLGDGSTLPFPITGPHAQLPGDRLADRMAGAISATERERQREEEESGLKFDRPEDRHAESVRHYDADVLAKVITYIMIGLASGSFIPAFLELIHLR